jgi:hypothetical protein
MFPSQDDIDAKRKMGVIEPTKLRRGTTLIIETTAKIFEFEMLGGGRALVRSSGKDFKKNRPCQIVGSLSKDGTLFADMLVYEKHMIISLPKGRHVTGLIRSASVKGPGWSYELWNTID